MKNSLIIEFSIKGVPQEPVWVLVSYDDFYWENVLKLRDWILEVYSGTDTEIGMNFIFYFREKSFPLEKIFLLEDVIEKV